MLKTNTLCFPVLIADIGGTNARFSCLFSPYKIQDFSKLATKHFRNIDQAIEESLWPAIKVKPKSLVLAIAGPVDGEIVSLTNCPWQINPKDLMAKFGFEKVLLLNDFEAQALASLALSQDELYPIIDQFFPPSGNLGLASLEKKARVILGPGTGLGVTALVSVAGCYSPIPSEGGHVDYAPQTKLDFALYPFLLGNKPRLSAEEVLSGRGLLAIYSAFCAYEEKEQNCFSPDEITQAAHRGDLLAQKTIGFFIDYLARLAGDLALILKAEAGLYIAGGIVPQLLTFLDVPRFRAFFENKYPHQALLAKMPVYVMLHPQAALKGLQYFLQNPEKFFINCDGRFWQKA